jgi:hypothetical protein
LQNQYTYIISVDGTEYGPAPLSTVADWAQDGRLKSQSIITEVQTGRRFAAAEHPFLRERLPKIVAPPPIQPPLVAKAPQIAQVDDAIANFPPRPKIALISVMWGLTAIHYAIIPSANGDPTLVFGSFIALGIPSTIIGIILAFSKSKTDRINGIIKLILMALALVAIVIFLALMPRISPQP